MLPSGRWLTQLDNFHAAPRKEVRYPFIANKMQRADDDQIVVTIIQKLFFFLFSAQIAVGYQYVVEFLVIRKCLEQT